MDKKNTVTIRLTDEQFGWLRALSRRSKRSQSEVVRSLIEHGTVRERITRENLDIIRKLSCFMSCEISWATHKTAQG